MALFEMPNLGAAFNEYFSVVPALTDKLREHAYRIRHQVYCEELGFEAVRPDGRERDEYDSHSLHCLIRSEHEGAYIACTRLILTPPDDQTYPLPFERICANAIDRSIADPSALARDRIAEVSRLAVVSSFRRRIGEDRQAAPLTEESFGTKPKPRFPYLMVGLYLGTVELAKLHHIETLFVLTEPRLAKHFARLGVEVKAIGRAVEHRGTRIPSVMNVKSIIGGLNDVVRPLYEVIAGEVRRAVREQKVTTV